MLIAVHYVRINGVMFTPGETITESLAPEKEARLLGMGAIRKAAEAPISTAQEATEGMADDDTGNAGDEAKGNVEEAEEEADEEYEDAEPMEIDAAESITTAAEPVPKDDKPARKRRGGKESKA